jgi:integrase
MFSLQRVVLPSGHLTYTVLGDGYRPVEAVDSYLSYLDSVQKSPNTIRAYGYGLAWYFAFLCERNLRWEDVKLQDVALFIQWLRSPAANVVVMDLSAARVSNRTVNLYLSAVTGFYEYQVRNGCEVADRLSVWRNITRRRFKGFLGHITPRQPLRRSALRLPQTQHGPKTLTLEQIRSILQHCRHKRDLFLFGLLWETGMRIGEALGLRHEDMHTWELAVRVVPRDDNLNGARAKSRRERDVHISKELARLYSDYMHDEYGLLDSDYVFVNLFSKRHFGAPLHYSNVDQLVRRLRKVTGITAFHPHMFRHTHATDLRQAGVLSEVISRRLGHSSVLTTEAIYTHLDDDFLRGELRSFWEQQEQRRHSWEPD